MSWKEKLKNASLTHEQKTKLENLVKKSKKNRLILIILMVVSGLLYLSGFMLMAAEQGIGSILAILSYITWPVISFLIARETRLRLKLKKYIYEIIGGKAIEGVKNFLANRNSNKAVEINDQDPTLKRAWIFLEDKEFDKALEYADKTLDKNPELGSAYLVKLMAELKENTLFDVLNKKISLDELENNKDYQKAKKFATQSTNDYINENITKYRLTIQDASLFDSYLVKLSQDKYSGDENEYEETIKTMESRDFANKDAIIKNAKEKLLRLRIQNKESEIKEIIKDKSSNSFIVANSTISLIDDPVIKKQIELVYKIELDSQKEKLFNEAVKLSSDNLNLKDLSNALEIFYILGDYKNTTNIILDVQGKMNAIKSKAKKKLIIISSTILSSLILVATLVYLFTAPLNSINKDGFHFIRSSDAYSLEYYSGKETNLVIPSEIRGLPVTKINDNAFKNNVHIKSITIPETITAIGENAFFGTINLQEIINFSEIDTDINLHGISIYTIELFNGNNLYEVIEFTLFDLSQEIELVEIGESGKEFAGWYDNPEFSGEPLSKISVSNLENISLYAKWLPLFTITFDSNGGTIIASRTQNSFGGSITQPTNPTKIGYTFDGWYLIETNNDGEGNLLVWPYTPNENMTVYAKWSINQYSINFNSNGGSLVEPIIQNYETTILEPTNPIKDGYTFGGWYSDSNLTKAYIWGTMPAQNITLYAKWNIVSYSIDYALDDGENHSTNPIFYTIETTSITLGSPTKEGYTFNGWYTDSSFAFEVTQITTGSMGDITLHAKWVINSYEMNYYIQKYKFFGIPLSLGETIIQVSSDYYHSSALTASGRIFTWGEGDYGRLGNGASTDKSTPTEITNRFSLTEGDKIIQVSLGGSHSSALTASGRLFTWGNNSLGQLGDGTNNNSLTPIEITNRFILAEGDKIIQVSLGYSHSAALTASGRLFTWGYNSYYQLGNGSFNDRTLPTEITNRFSLTEGDKIIQVSLGYSHSAALTASGRLFTWGYNFVGELGNGTTTYKSTPTEITGQFNLSEEDKIIQVSLGGSHSSALTASGRIFTWGEGDYGRLGNGASTDKYTPTEITNRFSLTEGDKIIQVSLGGSHSSALTASGRLFTWGNNSLGQLGVGTTTNSFTPTEITNRFSLTEGDKIIQVSLGWEHSLAITSDGRFYTWGDNVFGQLGDGTTTAKYIPNEITQSGYDLLHFDDVVYKQNIAEFVPTKEGYTFSGWYSDIYLTTPYVFGTMPAQDIVLYAKWIKN